MIIKEAPTLELGTRFSPSCNICTSCDEKRKYYRIDWEDYGLDGSPSNITYLCRNCVAELVSKFLVLLFQG